MRTNYRTSLTGQTVRVEKGVVLSTGTTVPEAFEAEVLSTWFAINGTVETVEVVVPGYGRRMAIWEGFAPLVAVAA